MTLLEINLTDVLSETDPDDRVIVWAPVMREGPAGQLVGPRRKAIPLVDGVGSDEVVPGPLMVQVQCKAMSDTRPREVVVPEEGPVTLTALFDSAGAFTYSPAVVGQVGQYRNQAMQAAADADLAADLAEAGAATVAGHATQTADDRRQTGEDRTQTGLDRQAAAQSATDAATSATTAEGHKTTVQTALAGARLYSGTGFPEGVVTAPVGSIYTDTAATNGAIRWIKTSGTGNTGWQVEYGDTGWRDVTSLIAPGWSGNIYITRSASSVRVRIEGLIRNESTSTLFCTLPHGFRPSTPGPVVERWNLPSATNPPTFYRGLAAQSGALTFVYNPGVLLYGVFELKAATGWPTTLPGIPA